MLTTLKRCMRLAYSTGCLHCAPSFIKPSMFATLIFILSASLSVPAASQEGSPPGDRDVIGDDDLIFCAPITKRINSGDYRTVEWGLNKKLDTFFKSPKEANIKVVRYWVGLSQLMSKRRHWMGMPGKI